MSPAFPNKMEFVSALIIFSILAALVAGLYFAFGGSKMRPWHYDDPPFLRSRSNHGDTVIVAREAADVDKPMAAMARGGPAEYYEMIRSERFSSYATARESPSLKEGRMYQKSESGRTGAKVTSITVKSSLSDCARKKGG